MHNTSSHTDPLIEIRITGFSISENKLLTLLNKKETISQKYSYSLWKTTISAKVTLDNHVAGIVKTHINPHGSSFYIEQVYTFFDTTRNIVIISYLVLISTPVLQNINENSLWYSIDTLPGLEKTDEEILRYAHKRLKGKIEYTNIVYALLPSEFTYSMLQNAYEAIIGKSLDKRNFRKKIQSLNLLSDTGRKNRLDKARPARIFQFRHRELTFVRIL